MLRNSNWLAVTDSATDYASGTGGVPGFCTGFLDLSVLSLFSCVLLPSLCPYILPLLQGEVTAVKSFRYVEGFKRIFRKQWRVSYS